MRLKMILGFEALLLITFTLFLVYTNYKSYVDIQISLGNSLFSERAVSLIFQEDALPELSEMDMICSESENITLYAVISESNSAKLYGYYQYFTMDRGFIELDPALQNKKFPQAVVGRDYLETQPEKGDGTLRLAEKSYRIDGIISSDAGGLLKKLAFIRLEQNDILPAPKIIIDGSQEQEIGKAVQALTAHYNVKILKSSENVMKKTLYNDADMKRFDMLATGLFVLLVLLAAIYWVKDSSEEMRIEYIVGIKPGIIFRSFLKRLCIQTAICLFLSLAGYTLAYFLYLHRLRISYDSGRLALFAAAGLLVIAVAQGGALKFLCARMKRNGVKE